MAGPIEQIEKAQAGSRIAEFGFLQELPKITIPIHDARGNVKSWIERTPSISRFDQHPETSKEITDGIKKKGGVEGLLKDKKTWGKINKNDMKRQEKIANPFGAKYGKDDIEQKAARVEEAQKYALACCRLAAGAFEGLSLTDMMDIIIVSGKKFRTLEEWAMVVNAARGK